MAEGKLFAPWIPLDTKLDAFHDGIREYVAKHLEPFNLTEENSIDTESKSIVDPLIGYIHLRPWEVALLDTNLFQRLRRIRQVGLAYLVYPTLGYSRFEHTLGVLGNAMKLLDRIKQVYSSKGLKDVSIIETIETFEIPLRLATLFHDLGHCIFSHVSERVFSELEGNNDYPSTKYIIRSYTKALGLKKNLAPAEVLSIAIISSPEIRAFANRLNIPEKSEESINKWLEAAARFIAGSPVKKTPKTIFLAQILSSGIDADKIDYMQRDARLTGISLGIDLTRLYDKLRVFQLSASELPPGLSYLKTAMPSNERFFVLGLTHGGQFAFEEFCIARASLYDKIYLHQKVRAAEAQLSNLLIALPKAIPLYEELHRWLYLSENIIDHEDLPLPSDTRPFELFKRDVAAILKLKPIHLRNLLKRAFAFGFRNSLSEPGLKAKKNDDSSPTWVFIQELKTKDSEFLRKLKLEILKVGRLVKRNVTDEDLDQIAIDIPDHNRVQQGATSIYIKQPITLPHRWALPIDQIAEYYRQRALSYIFAPASICSLVAAASEKLIYETYGLEFEQKEFLGERIEKSVSEIKETLSATEFYQKTPALKVKSEYLLMAETQENLSIVVNNLSEFKSFKGDHVTPARVSAFLMQFPEDLQPPALDLLTMLRVVDPMIIAGAMGDECKRLNAKNVKNILLAPIGNLTDSATHLLYFLKNSPVLSSADTPTIALLNDNTIASADYLILFDDNINSSAQTLNILAEWLGVSLPQHLKLKEKHVAALQEESKAKLRSIPIHFIYGVGPRSAKVDLLKVLVDYMKLDEHKVTITLCQTLDEHDKPLTGKNSKLGDKRLELREFLEKVGTELLKSSSANLAVANKRALGYSGTEGLVLLQYNVPSMTIAALWCPGIFEGIDWLPLCERRRNWRPDGPSDDEGQ